MTTPNSVVDMNGTRFVLGRVLGTGGQGAVYEAEGGRFAVKLLPRAHGSDFKRVERQFLFLKQLELDGVPIARPLSVLRQPHIGYVMPLLQDMSPIAQLMLPPPGCRSLLKWYREGGGLKRRLNCLASAAQALAGLHSLGLCYGDVSPANIFIPVASSDFEAWLIDSDNLRFDSSISSQHFYTPGFGAPEVVNRLGTTSTLSDAHSTAVLVFQTLAQLHPLIGDAVHDGEPELEERAYAGKLPWVDHPTDAANRSTRGIPREVALSSGLNELAARAFGTGLLDKTRRPSVGEWADALRRAAANCLTCRQCNGSFYRQADYCPWCGAPRGTFVYGKAHTFLAASRSLLRSPDGRARVEDSFAISEGDTSTLLANTAYGLSAKNRRSPILRVRNDGKSLVIERLAEEALIEIRIGTKRGQLKTDPLTVPIDASIRQLAIHFGADGDDHRIVDFSVEPGGRA
jgi:DNA-binding helix-hairpin-helix protein with protein kinase domain